MMWRPWSAEDVQRVFKTESRQKDRQLFLQSHYPIGRILVSHNRIGLTNGSFVSESDIIGLIHESKPLDHNRVIFVVGETGSGKSELCQWLEYNLKPTHYPIHISRSQSTLAGILNTLKQTPVASRTDSSLPPREVLADHLRVHLRLLAHRSGQTTWIQYTERLKSDLEALTTALYENGQSLSFDNLSSYFPSCPDLTILRQWLQRAVRDAIGIHTLEPILAGLATTLAQKGQRPVLLLEDVTTLGFLRDDLLDFVFDLSVPGFDVVMGLTSGFESSHLYGSGGIGDMAYVRDRVTLRLALSNGNGETFFLTSPEALTKLFLRYLNCLPARPSPKAFQGIYPFTPVAIERLFVHLVESGTPRQTPRNLLDAVIRPLLCREEPPYVALMERHAYIRSPSILFRQDNLSTEEVALLYWYGNKHKGRYLVDREIAQAFGFERGVSADAFDLPAESTRVTVSLKDSEEDRRYRWEEAFRQLRDWQLRGKATTFPLRHYLKAGIQRFINAAANPRLIQHPYSNSSGALPLRYHRGADTLPLYLPGSGDAEPEGEWPVLIIPKKAPQRILEEFLNYSFGAPESLQCFTDPTAALEMVMPLVETFQTDLRKCLRNILGMPLETFVFGAWRLIQQLTYGLTERELADPKRLLLYAKPKQDNGSPWRVAETKVLSRTNLELLTIRGLYQGWFISLFHTRDDFLDADLLQRQTATYDADAWQETVKSIDLRKIRTAPFRLDATEVTLFDLVRPVAEYVQSLASYKFYKEDVSQLKQTLKVLEAYLGVDPNLPANLAHITELTQRLGWTELKIPPPPVVDHETGRELEQHIKQVLEALTHSRVAEVSAVRYWLARSHNFAPLAWDSVLLTYVDHLREMLDLHLPPPNDNWSDRSSLAERALHVTVALRSALQ